MVWVTPEKKSRQISIDQVRERLLRSVTQTSFEGGWKAGVLLAADRLTPPAANAFMKTLEEPPPQTLFLLLTDSPQGLPPTIVSRCQRIDVSGAPQPPAAAWRDSLVAMLSTRPPVRFGDAVASQLCALLGELKQDAEREARAEAKEESEVEVTSDALKALIDARYRERRRHVLVALQYLYRYLLVLRAGGEAETLRYPQCRGLLQPCAQRLTLSRRWPTSPGPGDAGQLERTSREPCLPYWMDR